MNPIQPFEYQEFRRSFSPRRITISPYKLPLQPTPEPELEPEWKLPESPEWYTWEHRNNLFIISTRFSPYIKKLGFHRTWACIRPILEDVSNAWLVWLERETWPLINLDRWERLANYMNNYWPNVRNSSHIWYPLLEYMDHPEGMPMEDYIELRDMTIQAELELEGGIGNQFVLVFTETIKGFNNYFNRQLEPEDVELAADNLAWTITAASIIISNLTPSVVRTPFRSPYIETWETTSAWRYIKNWWNICLSKHAFRQPEL